jgi:hypothetical protein
MKRNDPGEIRNIEGHYVVTLALVKRLCGIMNDAFGSFTLYVNDYELEGLHEVPLIPDAEVKKIDIVGRKKPPEGQEWMKNVTPKVSVYMGEKVLLISQTEKYDFVAIGVVTRVLEVLDKAKVESPKTTPGFATCEISLEGFADQNVPAAPPDAIAVQGTPAAVGAGPVPTSLLDVDKIIQATEKSFWRRNKDKIIVGIILSAVALVGGIILAVVKGWL